VLVTSLLGSVRVVAMAGVCRCVPRGAASETAGTQRYGAGVTEAVTILPVGGLPEIEPGADLAAMIHAAIALVDGDIVLVTSKIVSKAEGRVVELADVTPSEFADRWGRQWDKDPRVIE